MVMLINHAHNTRVLCVQPWALFRKSVSNNIDFLNSGPGVVFGKLSCIVMANLRWKTTHELMLVGLKLQLRIEMNTYACCQS